MIPAALAATSVYRWIVLESAARHAWIPSALKPASYGMLSLAAVDVLLLIAFGPIRSRVLIGPLFEALHAMVFLLGTPALENVLVLRGKGTARWFVTVPLSTIAAEALLFLQ